MQATLGKARGPGRPVNPALHEQRREAILASATLLFARHGYAETEVEWIAQDLGLSKGTVYRYFSTKQELFLAAVDYGLNRLRKQIDHVEAADPLAKLEKAIAAYLAFFRANPAVVELLIQERAAFRDRNTQPAYFARRAKDMGSWPQLVEDLITAKRIRPIPVQRVLEVLGDLVFGTMFTDQVIGRKKPLRVQARDLIDVAFNGILTQQERKRRRKN